MTKSLSINLVFLFYISTVSSSNILAIFTLASPSHYMWVNPLIKSLANQGHNVTILSPHTEKRPLSNVTNIIIEGIYDELAKTYNYAEMSEKSVFYWVKETYNIFETLCIFTLHSDGFSHLLNCSLDMKFDLLLIDAIGSECLLGLRANFDNPPVVVVNSLSIAPWTFEITGTSSSPSHIPFYYSHFTDEMTFLERTQNFITNFYSYITYNYVYLPTMNKEAKKYFGPLLEPVYKTMQNISLALVNFHPVLNYPFPIQPNLIPVAGMHIKDPKPLPNEVQTFLDEARDGAIFFSLGTNVRSDKLSLEKRTAIIETFAELRQRVLWKFESDLPNIPENVKIGKFFPQNDILAHPNLKLFITHAGMLSMHEAITRAVPVVGIPFLVDQHSNIRRMVHFGCGVLLEYKDLTKHSFFNAIMEVLQNSSYAQNVKDLSVRFQDNPQKPLERAIYWIEYVIRHKGAPHLQSAAKSLNFIQYFLLDVIAVILAVPALVFSTLYYICCRRRGKNINKEKIT